MLPLTAIRRSPPVGVGARGILVSGHDLHDLEIEQTVNTGIDVYTHSEMLPAHYYPAFKKYEHFKGNYGNAWWKQKEEFEAFQRPDSNDDELYQCRRRTATKTVFKDRQIGKITRHWSIS